MRLPASDAVVLSTPLPGRATSRDLKRNSFDENRICFSRFSVIAIDDRIASILRACSAGIIPENSKPTHWQCNCARRQISLPRSTSKPFRLPSGAFESIGG